MAAEDARPAGGPALETLIHGTRTPGAPALRAAAVRALGRLETPDVADRILPLLADPSADVRAEAANALAQAVHRGDGTAALAPLLARTDEEHDPWVRGVLARSLGRLRLHGEARRIAGFAVVGLTRLHGHEDALPEQLEGAALGLESFARKRGAERVGPTVAARIRELTTYGDASKGGRIRELALLALTSTGEGTDADVATALSDTDPAVRRVGAALLARLGPTPDLALVDRALSDAAPAVRLEGVRAAATRPRDDATCRRLVGAFQEDADTGVRLVAADALAWPCPPASDAVTTLNQSAAAVPDGSGSAWHVPTHAFVALARVAPNRARPLLARFSAHADPFVRAWAARAAAELGDATSLRTLATDTDANTRAAALEGLATVEGHAADPVFIQALDDDAPQVILAAAAGLAGTALHAPTKAAALQTLQRLGRTGKETLRDPRVALVDLVGSLGTAEDAASLEPFLRDFDAAVAEGAARALERWTGQPYLAAPRHPRRLPLPTAQELMSMARGEVVLRMAGGGSIHIRLDPVQAPTNAFRFYSMVRAGTLDGLTFHRWVPNFVLQGGSPLANEYAGHGAFTRDEVGLPVQWRGTVGLSTRGRDTGDGQIYVNLVDDVRLDHDYTIFGVVTAGMDVVDGLLEGARIETAIFEPTS